MQMSQAAKDARKLVRLRTGERDEILGTVIAGRNDRDAFADLHKGIDLDQIDFYQYKSQDVAVRNAVDVADQMSTKETMLNHQIDRLFKAHCLVLDAEDVLDLVLTDEDIALKNAIEAERATRAGAKHSPAQVRHIIRKVADNPMFGKSFAFQILHEYGDGVTCVRAMKPEFYDPVYEACQTLLERKRAPEATTAPHEAP
jgi:hypothetical protein